MVTVGGVGGISDVWTLKQVPYVKFDIVYKRD